MGTPYVIVHDGKDRESWREARRTGVGASDAPAIMGVNRFSSALSVFVDKVGLAEDDDATSPQARFGLVYEPQVVADFGEATGRRVQNDGRLIRSRRWPWMMTTLDARQWRPDRPGPGLVEVKTTRFDWEEEGGVPEHVVVQVQHQFATTGLSWGSVAYFNRLSCELAFVDVNPDPFVINRIVEATRDFWHENVLKHVPPDPDASEATAAALRALYPKAVEGKVVTLPGHFVEKAERLREIRKAAKRLESERREIENEVKAAIGDAERGVMPNGSGWTYATIERKGYVAKPSSYRKLDYKEKTQGALGRAV